MPKIRFTELVSTHAATGRLAGDWRAIGVSFCVVLAMLSLVSLALRDGALSQPMAPFAVVREPVGDYDLEIAAARLLTIEQIASALSESRFPAAQGRADAALADIAEQSRANVRVDVQPGEGGEASRVTIRWTGDPSTPGAAALVNQLAHDFVGIRTANRVASAERSRQAAATRVRETANALRSAEHKFESVLADTDSFKVGEIANEPATTEAEANQRTGVSPSTSAWRAQLQAQLAELESQRSLLAERLMPAHPEMRAIEAQIAAVRTELGDSASPDTTTSNTASSPPPVVERERGANPTYLTQVRRDWDALLLARREYETAIDHERSAWQALTQNRAGEPIEVLPASLISSAANEIAWWKIAAAGLPAWLAGWLVLLFWPSPSAPFTTAEQVRRATRLPVIIVPSVN